MALYALQREQQRSTPMLLDGVTGSARLVCK